MGRGSGVKTYALEFCEPVIANAAIFVLLIILDLWTQANSLIPIHAIAGIVAVLMTFALCRSSYVALSWGLVIIPAVFLIISFINAAQKSATVQALGTNLKYAYDKTAAGVRYGVDTVDYGYDALSDRVSSLNAAGQKSLSSLSNAWMTSYNALVNSGVKPAEAAVAATAENGKPPAGSAAATTAAASGANTTRTVVKGEYKYLCDPAPTDATLAAACQKCGADENPDKCISVISVNAVCLGNVAKGDPPSSAKRDACLACTNANRTTSEQDECRAAAIKGVAWVPKAAAGGAAATKPAATPEQLSNPFTLIGSRVPFGTPPPNQDELDVVAEFLSIYPDILTALTEMKGSPPTASDLSSMNKGIAYAISKKPDSTPEQLYEDLLNEMDAQAEGFRMQMGNSISGFQSGSGPVPADPSASAFKNAKAPVAGTAEAFGSGRNTLEGFQVGVYRRRRRS
jgi:hypothetical protein